MLNEKIDKTKDRISDLHQDTNQNFDDVKIEFVKIQATTQFDEKYANLNVLGVRKSKKKI